MEDIRSLPGIFTTYDHRFTSSFQRESCLPPTRQSSNTQSSPNDNSVYITQSSLFASLIIINLLLILITLSVTHFLSLHS